MNAILPFVLLLTVATAVAGDSPTAETHQVLYLADSGVVVLRLWSPTDRQALVLRTHCPRAAPRVPSLTGVFGGAAWHERATAELFGIGFDGHPDLAPLLLAEGFEGHPLRKDFPLAARAVKPWPGAKEPGESDADLAAVNRRRRLTAPGIPDWPAG